MAGADDKSTVDDAPTVAAVRAAARAHGLAAAEVRRLTEPGIANWVYAVGEHAVLRVPRAPRFVPDLAREALVVPVARAAGVRTPEVLAYDDSCRLLPAPYLLTEFVAGDNLGMRDARSAGVYRELGADLARWHARTASSPDPLAGLPRHPPGDPRPLVAELCDGGYLGRDLAGSRDTAAWLTRWFGKLADAGAGAPAALRVVHGDASPTNVLVTPAGRYRALLDWGDTGWADPATEFAKLPLAVLPDVFAGYRAAGGTVSEAGLLWHYLAWALGGLRAAPYDSDGWAAQPQSRLVELLRFLLDAPDRRWRELAP